MGAAAAWRARWANHSFAVHKLPLDILHAVKSQGLWEMTDSLGQARMARLLAILNCPLVIHTDYTGKRTAETCFHLYKPALEVLEIPCAADVCIWRN